MCFCSVSYHISSHNSPYFCCNCGSWWHIKAKQCKSLSVPFAFFWSCWSYLSELLPPTGKGINIWDRFPHSAWLPSNGCLAQVGWVEAFPFTGQVGKSSGLPSHSLASWSALSWEPMQLLPYVRVGCKPWTSTVLHLNSPE